MKKVLIGLGSLVALVAILLLALPTILHKAGLHPAYTGDSVELPGKRALVYELVTRSTLEVGQAKRRGAGLAARI